MFISFLITFREIFEAGIIIATISGILRKLGHTNAMKSVLLACVTALVTSILFIALACGFGIELQKTTVSVYEPLVEGSLMILSAVFVSWAVFFLHRFFGNYKTTLLQRIKISLEHQEQKGLFILVFIAVVREGIEITLFLSTLFFTPQLNHIFLGAVLGLLTAVLCSFLFFSATVRLPVKYAFRVTTVLLVLFAAGLIARGMHEFVEFGAIPGFGEITVPFIPPVSFLSGELVLTLFGFSRTMDTVQLVLYAIYLGLMARWLMKQPKGVQKYKL